METIVRLATAADAEIISSLNADVQALHASALPWRFKPPGADAFPPIAATALLVQPTNLVFVAELASVPVGYAYAEVVHRPETPFTYAYEMIHLHHISVRPTHRREGIGGALMNAVRAAANERGIALLTVDVWVFNEVSRAFFQRHGFGSYIERLWNQGA